eukprot:gene10609-3127_t
MSEEFSVGIVGPSTAGKTSIITQLIENKFITEHEPTMEESHFYKTRIDGELCDLTIYDTGGAEEFASLRDEIIPKADCFFFVISQEEDLSKQWSVILKFFTKAQFSVWKKNIPPIIILSNKSDTTNKAYTTEKLTSMAKTLDLPFLETSAKTGDGIKEAFKQLIGMGLTQRNPDREQKQVTEQDSNKRKSLSQRLSMSFKGKKVSGLGNKRSSGIFDMKINF